MYCPPGLKCIRRPYWIPLRCAHFVPPNFRLLRLLLLSSILPLLLVLFLLKDLLRYGRNTPVYLQFIEITWCDGPCLRSGVDCTNWDHKELKSSHQYCEFSQVFSPYLQSSMCYYIALHSLDFLSLLTWARKPRLDSNCRTHKMLSHFCVKLL